MLAEMMVVQRNGDKAAANKFIERGTSGTSEVCRFRLVRHSALGE